jgi:uncharacterized protein YndB with AHSA1/START domain
MTQQWSDPTIAAWLKSTERWVRRGDDASSASVVGMTPRSRRSGWPASTARRSADGFAEVSGEMHDGATVTFDVGAPHKVDSRILRRESPRRLVFTWSYRGGETDEVEIRLEADSDGTLLMLEQRSNDRMDWWLGAGSGWESALIRLHLLLRGEDPVGVRNLDSIMRRPRGTRE